MTGLCHNPNPNPSPNPNPNPNPKPKPNPNPGTSHVHVSRYGGDAGVVAFHYSLDGGKYWTLHRLFTLRDPHAPLSVGLLAQAPTGEGCTARFSEIRYAESALADPRDGS